jgi:hypothetical protein
MEAEITQVDALRQARCGTDLLDLSRTAGSEWRDNATLVQQSLRVTTTCKSAAAKYQVRKLCALPWNLEEP